MGIRSLNNTLQQFLDTFVRSGTDASGAVAVAVASSGLIATGGGGLGSSGGCSGPVRYATAGVVNTGSGGGGAGGCSGAAPQWWGGNGASGIVIVRYQV